MAEQPDGQRFLFWVGVVDHPVIAHSKFKEPGELTSQRFRFDGLEVLGQPVKLLEHTICNCVVQFVKVLGGTRAKFDLKHLPLQATAAS
jgi:hypothetical protein